MNLALKSLNIIDYLFSASGINNNHNHYWRTRGGEEEGYWGLGNETIADPPEAFYSTPLPVPDVNICTIVLFNIFLFFRSPEGRKQKMSQLFKYDLHLLLFSVN